MMCCSLAYIVSQTLSYMQDLITVPALATED